MGYDFNTSLKNASVEEITRLKDDLIMLFDEEVTARGTYFQEMRKFEGEIFETIKWLYEQEEWHVSALERILGKANIIVKEKTPKIENLGRDSIKIIKFDIDFEEVAVKNYTMVAAKATGGLKEILTGLMTEEIKHVKRLQDYVAQSQN
ncbi:MAG: hypothetical protein WC821_05280 [archaeon]